MMNNIENISIQISDSNKNNIGDFTNMGSSKRKVNEKGNMQGFVEIRDKVTNEIISQSNNLIVYRGRAMALARMFGKDLSWNSSPPTQVPFYGMSDKFISFFSVGSGGSASGNNQSPLAVSATDYQLNTHGDVSGSGDFVTINSRTYKPFDTGYPEFVAESEIVNNATILNALQNVNFDGVKRDAYLVAKIQVTLDAGDANSIGGTQEISEAGLFLAESNDINYDFSEYTTNNQNLELFARVTFPTISKNASRSFSITWYIYF